MARHCSNVFVLSACSLLLLGCENKTAPAPEPEPKTDATASTDANDPNVTRAKLNAHGVPAEYAAHFMDEKLVTISERRDSRAGATREGEYTFQGGRLLRYRGAKVRDAAMLDLQFDLQGVLQSGRGPDVTEEDIMMIRDRAQLLRSHALAQRAARSHSNGH